MKKHLLFLLCILLFFSSCRKEGLYSDSKDKKVDTVQFKANAKKWLQSKKEQSVDSEDFIKGFENSAQWNEISYSSLSLSEYIFFLPTNNNVSGTGLVFFVDKDDLKIQNSFVINITYSGSILSPSEIIKGLLRMKNNNFSGSITAYTLSNNFLWENGYSNGNPTYQKYHIKTEFQKQVIKTNGIGTNVIISKACKEYYLVTYWDDGSIDRELIGTFCDNGCEQTISIGKDGHQIIGLNCGNSGGSGGNSVSPDGITAYGGKLSCKSFTFYSPNSTSNWQEAGVKGLQLVGDWFGPWGGFQVKNYGNIYVGIPNNLANGTNITQGQAATAAAKAANRAAEIQMAKYFGMTSSQFGAITSGTIAAEFRELMQGFLSDDIGGGCTVSR
ncbi:MAG: hypothetical protein Q8K64_09580 [Sediminibacterium sp.]|nr:hypothetical protein [Sediminibacterium sp.]